ncbi:unnamed protein product, partial [Mesorhabditis spiculigera]
MRLLVLLACFEVYFAVTEAARPGQSCSSVIHCEGDSVCIEGYCLCVEGMKKLQDLCVEPDVPTSDWRVESVGLAGYVEL